jgi:hypothetical protein
MNHPDPFCLSYLANHHFIRNYPLTPFTQSSSLFSFFDKVWYCIGIIEGERYIHAVRFLNKTPKPGITSYYIEWFNTSPFSRLSIDEMPSHFESVHFWVHSGVALRKNFFLFEDRMSLIRSCFYYDEGTRLFYRMSSLISYLDIPDAIPTNLKIYTTVLRFYCFQKRIKKRNYDDLSKKKSDFVRCLKKFVECHNQRHFFQLTYPKLFEQAQFIICKDGNSS